MQRIVSIFVARLGVVTEYAKERFGLRGDALWPFLYTKNLKSINQDEKRKGVSQRVMDLQSLLPTSETYSEATLPGANIPKLFEPNKNTGEENQIVSQNIGEVTPKGVKDGQPNTAADGDASRL